MNAKKDQLKTLFKPLIKECIKELILEEGVLSSMISEVNKVKFPSVTTTTEAVMQQVSKPKVDNKAKIDEAKRKIYAALGSDNYSHIFENIEPLSATEAGTAAPSHSPLSGKDPRDPGVDISAIPGMNVWKTLVQDKKR
jgi:hypothetical protein